MVGAGEPASGSTRLSAHDRRDDRASQETRYPVLRNFHRLGVPMKFPNFRGKNAQQRQSQDNRNALDKDLVRQFQSGSLMAMDALGRPLEINDNVQYQPPAALIFQIMSATPVLDPNAP